MSSVSAYVVHIDGSDKAQSFRKHLPILDFLFDHAEAFDQRDMKRGPYTTYQTDDFVFTKADGTVFPPGEASWQGWLAGYAPFTEHLHEARYCNVYERNGEWEMMGVANMFANLAAPGEKTKPDLSGKLWDVVVPGAFLFKCVKDPSGPKGFKVKAMTLYGDGTPVVAEMIKRGMLKPEDLAK
ncbi:uncharacterized protein Z520_05438 [Fonsecaea multimorphosa CBS 102226]|uniref:SnoaL-like domain-containing protein n=1 Tax=Fonsecaea multimorphosa CBS 102226 TaxID=1442371 RepID=A0A0D2JZP4_9EURO|nr:uncharacterized protein Z520_05438 [Fonsecaea multimorphosa CBS 102226]KIX98977.1 hypothetical protein Z520_05438 [Fonsecaea multimorphosa CBS 102226]OAL25248.1 hypothetical protein AYO22_05125 [Fonsecaea multimorphosa]